MLLPIHITSAVDTMTAFNYFLPPSASLQVPIIATPASKVRWPHKNAHSSQVSCEGKGRFKSKQGARNDGHLAKFLHNNVMTPDDCRTPGGSAGTVRA